jgi:hypothetical protein
VRAEKVLHSRPSGALFLDNDTAHMRTAVYKLQR